MRRKKTFATNSTYIFVLYYIISRSRKMLDTEVVAYIIYSLNIQVSPYYAENSKKKSRQKQIRDVVYVKLVCICHKLLFNFSYLS